MMVGLGSSMMCIGFFEGLRGRVEGDNGSWGNLFIFGNFGDPIDDNCRVTKACVEIYWEMRRRNTKIHDNESTMKNLFLC
jgi:hypothetical protein